MILTMHLTQGGVSADLEYKDLCLDTSVKVMDLILNLMDNFVRCT